MLTTEQIINLANKPERCNESDNPRTVSVKTLALYALKAKRHESFL